MKVVVELVLEGRYLVELLRLCGVDGQVGELGAAKLGEITGEMDKEFI